MSLVLFTCMVGLLIAPINVDFTSACISLLAVAIGSGAAGTLNMWYESDLDALMSRTCLRPIPTGKVKKNQALYFGIGGAAGALPPVIGWTIATGSISVEPIILFLIIFLWTPSHFWALSLYKSSDYKKAKIPMLPIISGTKTTKVNILFYALMMLPAIIAPYFLNFASVFYLAISSMMSAYYVYLCLRLYRSKIASISNKIARKIFIYSIFYLFFIFLILLIDNFLKII